MQPAVDVLDPGDRVFARAKPAVGRRRLEAVDLLRGLLMILMALDHTRDYFSRYNAINPIDPMHSWPILFVTRWVTHLCAPGFIALAGASVYLQRQRGKTEAQVAWLLLTRGLWLVFLEVTLISFGWSFAWAPFLQVIWAVGISMAGLAALVRLPTWAIGGIGAAVVMGHNLLDGIHAERFGRYADVWRLVHEPGPLLYHGQLEAYAFYAALPWFGVICLGYAFGAVVTAADAKRPRITLGLAASFLTAFAVLRGFHLYGDPIPFVHLDTSARTAMSFFEVQKYPPSLEYVLATFGVLLLLFTGFDWAVRRDLVPKVRGVFEVYGRVPFFYYVLHIYLLHTIALVWTAAVGLDWRFWMGPGFSWDASIPAHWGYSLAVVYGVWLAAVATLYRPCVWFSGLKARRRDWWLSYL